MEHRTPARLHGAITLLTDPDHAPTVEQLTAGFLAGYRRNTREAYTVDLRLWGRWLAEVGVHPMKVERGHIELWMRHEEERGLKPATVSRRISTVRMFYRYLFEEGHLDVDPGARVRLPKVHDDPPADYLDRWDIAELVRVAGEDHQPEALPLVTLLALDGLRISEALSLNVGSIGREGGFEVARFVGKGNKPAIVPLAPVTARAVEKLTEGRSPDEPLLRNQAGRRMTRANAHALSNRLVKAARITKKVTPHTYRRSFVSVALDAGVALTDVQRSARHANPATTLRYDRRRRELERHATHVVAQQVAAAMRI